LACALIFPHTLAFNAPAVAQKTALILDALGLPPDADPAAISDAASGFCEALGINMRLSRHGVKEGDLETMAAEAHAIRRLLDNNPRDIAAAEIAALYRRAF
jgi:alcohol dehydrogenase class IV